MGRPVVGKAAGEVASLEEVVGEGVEHIVERSLAMGPVLQEIPNIGAAAFA